LLLAALEEMQVNPFGGDLVRLKGEPSLWRRRVGAYRIFFDVRMEARVIEVVDIARRTSTTY
jgi:mRNA-degrading endonuclease RelE of RelBE toxin-antitoxin system